MHHRVRDAQARARELVVGERVAGEAVGEAEQQQRDADHPVDLARPAERAGEEDAHEVGDDRAEEEQRRPVVDLAHHQAGAHVEAHCGAPTRRPADIVHALQRRVAAVVDDLASSSGTKKNVR